MGVGMTVLGARWGRQGIRTGRYRKIPHHATLTRTSPAAASGAGDVFNADVVTVVEACCLRGMELLSVVVALTAVCALPVWFASMGLSRY